MGRRQGYLGFFFTLIVSLLVACGGDGGGGGNGSTVSVSLDPSEVTLNPGQTQLFTATVSGSSNPEVSWQVRGGSFRGTTTSVTYTAPDEAGEYTLTATSVADTSKQDEATIIVIDTGPATIVLRGRVKRPSQNVAAPNNGDKSLNIVGALQTIDIAGLNAQLLKELPREGFSSKAVQQPIRGKNALVLERLVSAAIGGNTLFGFQNTQVVVVNAQGDIVSHGDINTSDGSFVIEINKSDVRDEPFALALAESVDGELVCKQPLEYDLSAANVEGENDNVSALFGFDPLAQALVASGAWPSQQLSPIDTGLFGFSPETGNLESALNDIVADSLVPTFGGFVDGDGDGTQDFLESCGDVPVSNPSISGDFTWTMPEGIREAFLYEYGLLTAFDLGQDEVPLVSTASIAEFGAFDMDIVKPAAEPQPLSLIVLDIGYIDAEQQGFPMTPVFDLPAALDPSEPVLVIGDESFDYGELTGNMALVEGVVTDLAGQPVPGAFVGGILDSDDILDFNFAITDSDGIYQMFLPATGESFSYFIYAQSPDDTVFSARTVSFTSPSRFQENFRLNLSKLCSHANNTLAAAQAINPNGGAVQGALCNANDLDYYAFSLDEAQQIIIDIDAHVIDSALDSFLTLWGDDLSGNLAPLFSSDDDGLSLDSRLVVNLLEGEYFIEVDAFDPDQVSGESYFYQLFVDTLVIDVCSNLESNDVLNPSNTPFLYPQAFVFSAICPAGDVDVFRLFDGGDLVFDILAEEDDFGSRLDSVLLLFDDFGNLIAENDDEAGADTLDSLLIVENLADDFYYIAIEDVDGEGSSNHFYGFNYDSLFGFDVARQSPEDMKSRLLERLREIK